MLPRSLHLSILAPFLVSAGLAETSLTSTTDAPAPERPAKPLSEQLLDLLRTGDAVTPGLPDVHPVHTVSNREAVVPPQCYTRHQQKFNVCYVCHQDAIPGRENSMNDADLQEAYSFSDVGLTNQWRNLFEDRSERVAGISDEEILTWIGGDNYTELPARLQEAGFTGWIPDLQNLQMGREAFDEHGFAKDGSHWVAFNYKPFPSTFWPTNGSTDDVMIRLSEPFRTDAQGNHCTDVYRANLAIVEANIKGFDTISCLPVDERRIGRDLDGDGSLGTAKRIEDVQTHVGAAEPIKVSVHIYPKGTEFLHTVRYIGLDEHGGTTVSTRMKEVRYMKKWEQYSHPVYGRRYQEEAFEKEAGHLPGYQFLGDHGLDNGTGWSVSGFIEDRTGRLRTLTYEENFSCMGCHNSIGSTIDKTFSFPRKVDGAEGWGYIDLKKMRDIPTYGEDDGEFLTYLRRVGGGSEFRNNDEMSKRWFRGDGTVDEAKVSGVYSLHDLITPSRERALRLNKAYRCIVEDQDYIYGKDATVTPPENVWDRIDNDDSPTLPPDRQFRYNILLDWSGR